VKAAELLTLAIDWLAQTYPDSLIVPELSIGTWGAALLDVAAITTNEIIGVEIKGEGDSPARLPLQAAIYSKAATRMFFLPCPQLEERCFKHIPVSWGKLVVRDGKIEQKLPAWKQREADLGWKVETAGKLCTAPAQLLQCLWRDELDLIAVRCAIITGKVDVETLRWELAEQVPLRRLRSEVCDALLNRKWGTQRGNKLVISAKERLAA
jgi:hypothetical protein